MSHPEHTVTTIDKFVELIKVVQDEWRVDGKAVLPWFRGESGDEEYPMTPTLYRVAAGTEYDENWLLQNFRQEAPILNLPILPETGRIDEWMFLARHVGLPTRLLDWTEGGLIALNFALRSITDKAPIPPVVWILNPFKLIQLTKQDPLPLPNIYPLTWFQDTRQVIVDGEIHKTIVTPNIGLSNFKAAWSVGPYQYETDYPVPIRPAYVHQRMIAQLSCFTIYGSDTRRLDQMLDGRDCLTKFIIDMPKQESLERLRTLGITYVNIMPDADGLAEDIKHRYPPT